MLPYNQSEAQAMSFYDDCMQISGSVAMTANILSSDECCSEATMG